MSIGIALLALEVGVMAGTGGAVGALRIWSGRRTGAAGLVGFGLASMFGGLLVLAFLLWLTPVGSWGMVLLGLVLGLWLIWLLVRCRLSRE